MCGVVALVNLDGSPVDRVILTRMTRSLSHRGPDGEGVWIDGPVGLGHRRLAVFDLSEAGAQPMIGTSGRFVVSFNGAIYDFRPRRAKLEKAGIPFRGTSDTEVLVAEFERNGPKAAYGFNGMFAIAAYDRADRQLHLLRDRFGTKPLYTWTNGKVFIAASEIRAILAHPDVPKRPNAAAAREYLTFQNLFRPHSFFEGVTLVGQGQHLVLDVTSGKLKPKTYWDFDFSAPDESISFDDAVAETRRLLTKSIDVQSAADVQVGAYLSGGVDSGAIAALASKQMPRLFTFTCGFDMSRVTGVEANFDERRTAEQTAAFLRARHFECVISEDDIDEGLSRLVAHLEDLRLGMAYPNFFIAELAGKLSKVVLSGAGGDELFGGYPWRYYSVFRSINRSDYERSYYDYWQRTIPESAHPAALSDSVLRATKSDAATFDIFKSVFNGNDKLAFDRPEDQISASLYFEARTFLHGILLLNDRVSSAHGLEERVPFLDNDLVDFAMRVPVKHKLARLGEMKRVDENEIKTIKQNQSQFDDGKNVLRHSLVGLLPDAVLSRPKQGFSSPEASWYRGSVMQSRLKELDQGAATAFLKSEFIRQTITDHLSGAKNNRLLIWSMLSLDAWAKQNFPEAGADLFAA